MKSLTLKAYYFCAFSLVATSCNKIATLTAPADRAGTYKIACTASSDRAEYKKKTLVFDTIVTQTEETYSDSTCTAANLKTTISYTGNATYGEYRHNPRGGQKNRSFSNRSHCNARNRRGSDRV